MAVPGIFHGVILEMTLSTTKNGLGQVVVRGEFDAQFVDGEFIKFEDDATFQAVGYFCLQKSDHSRNSTQIDSLKETLGWDGRNFKALADGTYHGTEIQGTFRESKDARYPGVKWAFINPPGSRPGLRQLDDHEKNALIRKLNALAEAQDGGRPIAAPPPRAVKPNLPTSSESAQKKAPSAPSSAKKSLAAKTTVDEAWIAFCKNAEQLEPYQKAENPEEFLTAEWIRIVKQTLHTETNSMTPEQCLWMAEHGHESILPF
jgi:hypothetical protein